jgi:hypothetical protein
MDCPIDLIPTAFKSARRALKDRPGSHLLRQPEIENWSNGTSSKIFKKSLQKTDSSNFVHASPEYAPIVLDMLQKFLEN